MCGDMKYILMILPGFLCSFPLLLLLLLRRAQSHTYGQDISVLLSISIHQAYRVFCSVVSVGLCCVG